MANPRATVDVVGRENSAGKFLCQIVFFVGPAGRAQNTEALRPILAEDLFQLTGAEIDGFLPRNFLSSFLFLGSSARRSGQLRRYSCKHSVL